MLQQQQQQQQIDPQQQNVVEQLPAANSMDVTQQTI